MRSVMERVNVILEAPHKSQAPVDHGVQDFVLGLEMKIEVAARDLHDRRDVREGRMLVAAPIE